MMSTRCWTGGVVGDKYVSGASCSRLQLKAKMLRSQSTRCSAQCDKGPDWTFLTAMSLFPTRPSAIKLSHFQPRDFPPACSLLSSSPATKTLLNGSLDILYYEPVFALRVEETRPMAGRPIWKTRSEYTERFGNQQRLHAFASRCYLLLYLLPLLEVT